MESVLQYYCLKHLHPCISLWIAPQRHFYPMHCKDWLQNFFTFKEYLFLLKQQALGCSEAWKVAFWKGVRLLLTDCGFKFLSSLHRSLWTFYRLGVARGGQFKFLSSVDRFLEAALVCISGGCKVDFEE